MNWWANLFPGRRPAAYASPAPESAPAQLPARPVAELLALLKPHERTAWLPRTVAEDHGAAASKFGGMALVSAEYPAPDCPCCGQPLPLFVQLNPQDLPAEVAPKLRGQMLQLFYCVNEACEPWRTGFLSQIVRLVPIQEPVAGALPVVSLPCQSIVGWQDHSEPPHPYEWAGLGVHVGDDESELLEESGHYRCTGCDKLGGWSYWIQDLEHAVCPHCKTDMDVLFQLASEDHLPYMFGDAGIGHIYQCPLHPAELGFNWSCS
jgi:hypothetical protein